MNKQFPDQWPHKCEPCTLNGASCYCKHYPLPTLEEALKAAKEFPMENGRICPYRPSYEGGVGRPVYDKPENLPEPKPRSRSPAAGRRVPGAAASATASDKKARIDAAQAKVDQHVSVKPKCCTAFVNTGKCPKGNDCTERKFHNKDKKTYDTQTKRWSDHLAVLNAELDAAKK